MESFIQRTPYLSRFTGAVPVDFVFAKYRLSYLLSGAEKKEHFTVVVSEFTVVAFEFTG